MSGFAGEREKEMKKGLKSKFIIVLAFVLAAVTVFGGCKKKQTTEQKLASAMEQTVEAAKKKTALLGSGMDLSNGLITVSIEIGEEDGINLKALYKNKKIVIDPGKLGSALGIDLGKAADKFEKSAFGTKGANLTNITEEEQKEAIETLRALAESLDGIGNAAENVVDMIKKYATMSTDYNKTVELESGSKKVDIVSIGLTAGQIEEFVKEFNEKYEFLETMIAVPFEYEAEEGKENELMVDAKLYTDTKSSEILGGNFKFIDVDGDDDLEIKLDVNKTADSVTYKLVETGNGEGIRFGITNKDNVETITVTLLKGDEENEVVKFVADGTAKKLGIYSGGSKLIELDYEVERYADNRVKSFSLSLDLSQVVNMFSAFTSSGYVEDDYYYDDDDLGYDDGDWDYDDGDLGYDDDDWGYDDDYTGNSGGILGMLSGKITFSYNAEGELPEFKDIFDMSEDEVKELVSSVNSMFPIFGGSDYTYEDDYYLDD